MHLINVATHALEEFVGNPPPYAILSHTWGNVADEITFAELQAGPPHRSGPGWDKVQRCCQQARQDKLEYAWIDTCCIDRTNLVALTEAINSMYRWYERATICYGFLADVKPAPDRRSDGKSGSDSDDFIRVSPYFGHSRWFERGWTLQELLAPSNMVFFDQTWTLIASRAHLTDRLSAFTGIPRKYISRAPGIRIHDASAAQRLSWAAKRETTRPEDQTYSLLGILDINMPMIYGEGGQGAFERMQREILQKHGDTSVLAWGFGMHISGEPAVDRLWAPSLVYFSMCANVVPVDTVPMSVLLLSSGRLQTDLPVLKRGYELFLVLNQGLDYGSDDVIGIPLRRVGNSNSNEYVRDCRYSSQATRMSQWLVDNSNKYARDGGLFHVFSEALRKPARRGLAAAAATVVIHTEGGKGDYGRRKREPVDLLMTLCYAQGKLALVDTAPSDAWAGSSAWVSAISSKAYLARLQLRSPTIGSPDRDPVLVVRAPGDAVWPWTRTPIDLGLMALSSKYGLEAVHPRLERLPPGTLGQHAVSIGGAAIVLAFREKTEQADLWELRVTLRCSMEPSVMPRPVRTPVRTPVDGDAEMQLLIQEEEYAELVLKKHCWISLLQFSAQKARDAHAVVAADGAADGAAEDERAAAAAKHHRVKLAYWKGMQHAYEDILHDVPSRMDKLIRHIDQEHRAHGRSVDKWLPNTLSVYARMPRDPWYETKLDLGADLVDTHQRVFRAACASEGEERSLRRPVGHHLKRELDNAKYAEPERALHRMASRGDTALASVLLEHGIPVDVPLGNRPSVPYPRSMTPLMAAAAAGHLDMVRLLLDKGACVERFDMRGLTPMDYAARGGHAAVVELLVDHGGAYTRGVVGSLALRYCQAHNLPAVAQALVDRGATTAGGDSDDESECEIRSRLVPRMSTLLVTAAKDGNDRKVTQLLAENGTAEDCIHVAWALGAAAGGGHVSTMQLLLERLPAQPDPRAPWSRFVATATLSTVNVDPMVDDEAREASVVRVLLEKGGADLCGIFDEREPISCLLKPEGMDKWLREDTTVVLLHHAGKDQLPTISGAFPLHKAAQMCSTKLALALIERGIDVNARDASGRRALQCTSDTKMQQLLKKHGAR